MMKNYIYIILAFVSMTFAACNPMKDDINNIKAIPSIRTVNLTLAKADYALLPTGNYAKNGGYFTSAADANSFIPLILTASYPQLGDGNKALVTYNLLPQVKPADSLYANVQYTVTASDYTDAAAAVGNGTFKTYSVAQATAFLEWKYPKATAPVNKIVLLTYQFFQTNVTTTAGVPVTEAFLLLSGGWQKIYLVSTAQYASLGRSLNNAFVSADVVNLPSYFNTLLKADPTLTAPKVGDVTYVSYKYFQSATILYQRITSLIFDGTNWAAKSVPVSPLSFLKKKGAWIADPTVYATLSNKAEFTVLDASVGATPAALTNAIANASFDVSGGSNNWTQDQIIKALVMILNAKYATAPVDETVLYKITYRTYNAGLSSTLKTFAKTSTGFVLVPDEN